MPAFLTKGFAAEGPRDEAEGGMAQAGDWTSGLNLDDLAVFLDVDGTLLGFEEEPGDVVADASLRALLRDLSDATHGALALISGRTIADLDRIVAPLTLAAGGTHGAEMRWPDDRRSNVAAEALSHVRPAVSAFVGARAGLTLEDKGAALAIHYRKAPRYASEIADLLDEMVAGHDLMVQHGKMVAEVKAMGSSKGEAIRRFMEDAPFRGRRPVFVGDDLTDEHGFAGVNALGGVSVKVGEGETIAHHRLADTAEVRIFLSRILSQSVS